MLVWPAIDCFGITADDGASLLNAIIDRGPEWSVHNFRGLLVRELRRLTSSFPPLLAALPKYVNYVDLPLPAVSVLGLPAAGLAPKY